MTITGHAEVRMAQRGITRKDIETVMEHGHCVRRTGVQFYVLRHKDLRELPSDQHLHGLTAVVSRNGTLMTAYKNKDGLKDIKKKHKYQAVF